MKRTALVMGILLAAVVFVPGTVSAQCYNENESAADGRQGANTVSWRSGDENDAWSSKWSESGDEQNKGTIVDTLAADGDFTTLVTAVKTAGLADTLSAPGDLTVFAPTDEAFANLPAGTVDALLANPTALADVLKNHVVAGRVGGDMAVEAGEAQSLLGNTLNIGYGDDGELYVDDARITVTDIHTSNGIIHVIDAVLVPQQ